VSFAAITLCVASQRVFIVVVYFVIDSVRKLLDTTSYMYFEINNFKNCSSRYYIECEACNRLEYILKTCPFGLPQPVTGLPAVRLSFGPRPGQGRDFFYFAISRPVLGSARALRALFLGIEQSGREADHSSPSNAEAGKILTCASTPSPPPHVSIVWCFLVGRRDSFTFTYDTANVTNMYSPFKSC
jgi:hypothetical protein